MYLLNPAPAVRVAQEERVVVVADKAAVAVILTLQPDGSSNCRIIEMRWA
jgi:hypothetical protein